MAISATFQKSRLEIPTSNLSTGGGNFGLAEKIKISLEIQGTGRFVQLISNFAITGVFKTLAGIFPLTQQPACVDNPLAGDYFMLP